MYGYEGAHMMTAKMGVTPIMNNVPATDKASPRLPLSPQAPVLLPVPWLSAQLLTEVFVFAGDSCGLDSE
jgi:hypothetical protein